MGSNMSTGQAQAQAQIDMGANMVLDNYRFDIKRSNYISNFIGNKFDMPTIDEMKSLLEESKSMGRLELKINDYDLDRGRITALIQQTKFGTEEAMEWLLINNATVDWFDDEEKTSLMWAVINNNYNKVCILLENGANPNKQYPGSGSTALMYAVCKNNVNIVKILLDYGADVNIKNNKNFTAIDIAKKKRDRNRNLENLIPILINKKEDEVISVKPINERIAIYNEKMNNLGKKSIGGGNYNSNNIDKMKYLKYKTKYLQLKNKL